MTQNLDNARQSAQEIILETFESFVRHIVPDQIMSPYHSELCEFLDPVSNPGSRKLVMVPRDHNKSRMMAFFAVYLLTKDPTRTILYVSDSLRLAKLQLQLIQRTMLSKRYRAAFPDMVHPQHSKRKKWTSQEMIVDSPRRPESLRDYSVFAASLDTEFTGQHFNTVIYDDVVVYDTSQTEEQRHKVSTFDALIGSIETADAERYIAGTPYHPADLYADLREEQEETYSPDGEVESSSYVYDVYLRPIEDSEEQDGTGEYLWPRKLHTDGKAYGFDRTVRARKQRQYNARPELFWSQYYMDPTKGGKANGISRDMFKYFDQGKMRYDGMNWVLGDKLTHTVAAFDPAFSKEKKRDWSALTVLAVDYEGIHYVLGTYRFQTNDIKQMYDQIEAARCRWWFRRLVVECIAAQSIIAQHLKDIAHKSGTPLKIETYTPTHEGTKKERMEQTLTPLYTEGMVMHNPQCQNLVQLEDELVTFNPQHDDCKDSLTIAVKHAKRPPIGKSDAFQPKVKPRPRSKFGGM